MFTDYNDMLKHVENVKIGQQKVDQEFLSAMIESFSTEIAHAVEKAAEEAYSVGQEDGESSGYEEGYSVGYDEGLSDGKGRK